MRYTLIIVSFLIAAFSASGQVRPEPTLAPEKLALRTQLEADKSVMQLTCGAMLPILPGTMRAGEFTKHQEENTKLRLEFYKAATRGETVKATYACRTDEGTIARSYLLAEKGKITHIADFSRDYWGGNAFEVTECTDLSLGNYVIKPTKEIVYEVLNEADIKGKILWLSCQTPKGRSNGKRITF